MKLPLPVWLLICMVASGCASTPKQYIDPEAEPRIAIVDRTRQEDLHLQYRQLGLASSLALHAVGVGGMLLGTAIEGVQAARAWKRAEPLQHLLDGMDLPGLVTAQVVDQASKSGVVIVHYDPSSLTGDAKDRVRRHLRSAEVDLVALIRNQFSLTRDLSQLEYVTSIVLYRSALNQSGHRLRSSMTRYYV